MIEVYLLENRYAEGIDMEILFHIKDTDYYLGAAGYEDYNNIESFNFTTLFWEELGELSLLTKLGTL